MTAPGPSPPRRLALPAQLLLLALALTLRLAGLEHGLDRQDPDGAPLVLWQDEVSMAAAVREGPLAGRLDPGVFVNWGTGALWTFAAADALVAAASGWEPTLAGWQANPSDQLLVHRLVSALAGALTVLVLARAGARLLGPAAGLAAGLVLAASCLHVRINHAGLTDSLLTLWLTLAWTQGWSARRALAAGDARATRRAVTLAGLATGAALATKLVGALALAWPLLTLLWPPPGTSRRRVLPATLAGLALAATAWLALSPHLLVGTGGDAETLRANSARLLMDAASLPDALAYHLGSSLWVGLGAPVLVLALLGALVLLRRADPLPDGRTLVLWLLPPAACLAAFRVPALRYAAPVLPGLCLLAAVGLGALVTRWLPAGPRRAAALLVLALLAAAPSLQRSLAFDSLLGRPDTRRKALERLAALDPGGGDVLGLGFHGLPPEAPAAPGRPRVLRTDRWIAAQVGDLPALRSDPAAVLEQVRRQLHRDPPRLILHERSDRGPSRHQWQALGALITSRYERVEGLDGRRDGATPRFPPDTGAPGLFVPWSETDAMTRPGPALDLYRLRAE